MEVNVVRNANKTLYQMSKCSVLFKFRCIFPAVCLPYLMRLRCLSACFFCISFCIHTQGDPGGAGTRHCRAKSQHLHTCSVVHFWSVLFPVCEQFPLWASTHGCWQYRVVGVIGREPTQPAARQPQLTPKLFKCVHVCVSVCLCVLQIICE